MALQDQIVEFLIAEGVDKKTNAKLVQPGKLLDLENGIFTEGTTIKKRHGYQKKPLDVFGGGIISSGNALANLNDELLLFDNGNMYSFAETKQQWINKGLVSALNVKNEPVTSNTYQQDYADSVTVDNVTAFVWQDTRGGVRCTVLDEQNGTQYLTDYQLNATATRPKVISVNHFIVCVYIDGTDLHARPLDPLSPATWGTEQTLAANVLAANPRLDAVGGGINGEGVFAYTDNANQLSIGYVRKDGTVGSPGNGGLPNVVSIAEDPRRCLTVVLDPSFNLWLGYASTANGVRSCIYSAAFVQLLAPVAIQAAATAVDNITGVLQTATTIYWLYETYAAASYNHYITRNTLTYAGVVGTPAIFIRSVCLVSKAWIRNTAMFFVCVHDSALQTTYFVVDIDGTIHAKMIPGNAGSLQAGYLTGINYLSADNYYFAARKKTKFYVEGNTAYSLIGLSRERIIYNDTTQYITAKLGKNLHVLSGNLSIYDGQGLVESGFHIYPENLTVSAVNAAGTIASGTYQVKALYEWYDAQGQRHQSAPSIAQTVVLAGANDTIRVVVPTLRITNKKAPRTNCYIVFYRTRNALATFYRARAVASTDFNDPTVDSITVDLTDPDATIASREILISYLPAIAPPPSYIIAASKNRLIVVDAENRTTLWYSKLAIPGVGVEFNDSCTIEVQTEEGDLTALGVMDDKYILFKRDAIYYVTGDGPDNNGNDNNFTEPQLITTDVGCTQPKSVTIMPLGLMFKTEKGIYLLTRDLNVNYIGAQVEAYNSETITSGQLIDNANQVRFITESGRCLVYDYYFNQWSTFTRHNGKDSLLIDNQYYYLKSDGNVYYEDATHYQDYNQDIHLVLETAWYKISAIQGFQRAREVMFLGDYKSGHQLKIKIAYDYQPYWSQELSWNPQTAIIGTTYGEHSPYGSESPYGGTSDKVYQCRFKPRKQKFESIRFRIEDIGSGNEESFALNAISMRVAVKKGMYKLADAKNAA